MNHKDPIYTMFSSGQPNKATTDGIEYSKPKLINLDRMETAFGQACNPGAGGGTNCINGSNPNMFCFPGFGF